MPQIYPPDLVPLIEKAWSTSFQFPNEKRPHLPSSRALSELLSIAYHTSLLREEGRRLAFRILVMSKPAKKATARRDSRLAEFTEGRTLSVAELRRLAPAANSTSTMLCAAYTQSNGWTVWGLLDTGENWWRFTRHESSGGTPPPQDLTIGSPGPGELTISSGGFVLLTLRNGTAYLPRGSALDSGPVSDHFDAPRRELYKQTIRRLKSKKFDEDDNDYPQRFHDMCLSRILSGIQDLGHGGTLIVVPDELSAGDSRLTDRINIKHPCNYDYVWELMLQHLELHDRYYGLHFPLWDAEEPIRPKDYQDVSLFQSRREDNDEALSDCIRFIASLSSVDGALVMTDRFRVLGFGAEVIAQSPTLREVQLAANPKASEKRGVSIEAYGTRHRSAFRFCSSYEHAIAFIVSSDGGVKATKRIGAQVFLWPEVQATFWGA